ncbi:MAG: hypothetical protein RSC48_02735 [Anaerorhabdus sp.]
MNVVFQSIIMGALVIIAIASVVFPILFLIQRSKYQKKKLEILKDKTK